MKIKVFPKKGLTIHKPGGEGILSPHGELVDDYSYWRRRIAEGDVYKEAKKETPKDDEEITPSKNKYKGLNYGNNA